MKKLTKYQNLLNELLNNSDCKYVVGSTTIKLGKPNIEEIELILYNIFKHYLMNNDFYLNCRYSVSYLRYFNTIEIPKIKENIDKYITYNNNILTINKDINSKMYINNYILNSDKITDELRNEYINYANEYYGTI